MTVSLSKRSIINLNAPYAQEYAPVDVPKFYQSFPAASDFAGPWVVKWTGTDTLQFAFENPYVAFTVNDALSSAYTKPFLDRLSATDPRIVFSFDSGQPIRSILRISFIGGGNGSNLHIYRLEDEADFLAGRMFRRGHHAVYAGYNPSAIRAMNWLGGSDGYLMRWEHRSLPTDINWFDFCTSGNIPTYGTTGGTNIYTLAAIGSTPASEQHGHVAQCTIGTGMVRGEFNDVTGVTKANPGVVTYTGADNYQNGDKIIFRVSVGMTELDYRICTVANVNTGANTFELSGLNTSGFTTWVSGRVMQYISLKLGTWGAYPVIFHDGTTPGSFFGSVYMATGDIKAFYFDKSLIAAKDEATGADIQGAWMFNNFGAQMYHRTGVPPACVTKYIAEYNEVASALGKGPADLWVTIPVRGMLSMDADYSAASNVAVKTVDLFLNGGDGVAAVPAPARIIIELDNELWNAGGGFTGTSYCSRRAYLRWGGGGSAPQTYHALRHAVMVSDIRAAFPNNLDRIVFVMAGQGSVGVSGANLSLIDGDAVLEADSLYLSLGGTHNGMSAFYDAFAFASYISATETFNTANLATLATAWTNGNAAQKDQAIADYLVGVLGSTSALETLAYYRDLRLPEYAAKMATLGRKVIGYEGGCELSGRPNLPVDDAYHFMYAVKSSQQWATLYRTFFDKWLLYDAAAMPGEFIMIQSAGNDHRWDHIAPGHSDTYDSANEGGALDHAWRQIADFNNEGIMANLKTSAENAAATLDGTELIRAVQSSSNVKATVDQIAARTVAKARTVTAKTAGYTLLTTDSGSHFTNSGAAGAVALTLPAAAAGLQYSAEVMAAQTFGFTAAGGAKIYIGATGSAANGTATANALKATLVLICDGTDWAALGGAAGTWTVT